MVEIAGVVAVAATTGDPERGGVVFETLLRFAMICIFLRRAARRARMPWTTVGAYQLEILPSVLIVFYLRLSTTFRSSASTPFTAPSSMLEPLAALSVAIFFEDGSSSSSRTASRSMIAVR